MFIDQVDIYLKAGDGGNGLVAYRREKYVPLGGPSGGDGGNGGPVSIVARENRGTVAHLDRTSEIEAFPGVRGKSQDRTGRRGKDRIIEVPVGTVIWREASEGEEQWEWLGEVVADGRRMVVARGGRGGLQHAADPHRL